MNDLLNPYLSSDLIKKLNKAYGQAIRPNFSRKNIDDCDECVLRHEEIAKGRKITLEDLSQSCYSYMFFEAEALEYLMPFYFKKLFDKEENKYETFSLSFLENLREESIFPQGYSKHKSMILIEALKFVHTLYFMEEYEVWDFELERMISYEFNKMMVDEIDKCLEFWNRNSL